MNKQLDYVFKTCACSFLCKWCIAVSDSVTIIDDNASYGYDTKHFVEMDSILVLVFMKRDILSTPIIPRINATVSIAGDKKRGISPRFSLQI